MGHTTAEEWWKKTTRVLIIGRFDPGRWKKGGILKSCKLMKDQLEEMGLEVISKELRVR